MSKKTVITDFAPDGSARLLYGEESHGVINAVGTIESTERVTHVEPVNPFLRAIFGFCRWIADDASLIADFTRSWGCPWQANIIDGPTLGPVSQRQSAIDAERDWLLENHFGHGGD